MGWPDSDRCPARDAEALARMQALRAIGYRGRVDADGYAADDGAPGANPGPIWAGACFDGTDDRSLRMTAWAAGRFDGGWDGDAGGEGPLPGWLHHRRRRHSPRGDR
jgi:hypothetical protein